MTTQIEQLIDGINDCLKSIEGKESQLYDLLVGKSEMWKIGFFNGLRTNSLSNTLSHDYNVGSDAGMIFRVDIPNMESKATTKEIQNYIRHYMFGLEHLLGDKKHI